MRPIDKPFRFCVSDVYKGKSIDSFKQINKINSLLYIVILFLFTHLGQGSFVVAGKVESGTVQNGDRMILMPAAESGVVKGKSETLCFVLKINFKAILITK